VVGGRFGSPTDKTNMHDVYDPANNSWSAAPAMPTARSGLAATLYKDLVVVLGGELPPSTFSQNEAYDPRTKSWRALTPMPAGRHGTGAAAVNGALYIVAGSLRPGSAGVTNEVLVFTLP
jgi:N-acetylneuraminic acid mutarotase